jgi:low temperature requirement protein LtrA
MCAYVVLALAVPEAFHGSGLAFGLAYLMVVVVHTWLFATGAGEDAAAGIRRLAPSNLGNAALVLVGGALGGTAQIVLWTMAFGLMWVLPRLLGNADFDIAPAHFVERHGLVVIVAIGESVVAIGIGAAGLPVTVELCVFAVAGLLLSAGLWWTYFGGDDERAERALTALPRAERGQAALEAFGYAHFLLLLAIVCIAVGLKRATGHPYDALALAPALALGGGTALFLAGDAWFRRLLHIGSGVPRLLGAVVALATIPTGTAVAAIAQLALLAAVIAGATKLR